jgi:hypothetical protein
MMYYSRYERYGEPATEYYRPPERQELPIWQRGAFTGKKEFGKYGKTLRPKQRGK